MKKFLLVILLIFLFPVICFANEYKLPNYLQVKYKADIEKIINKDLPKTIKCIDKESINAKRNYNKYLKNKKDIDKYIFIMEDYQRGIEVCEFNFASLLTDTTNKYTNIKNIIPPTDFPGTILDIVYPYFDANNIDYKKINELDSYTYNKIKEIDSLIQKM